jgi:hypothetical protein
VPAPRGYATFQHALAIDGQIAGTWRTVRGAREMSVTVTLLRRLSAGERRAIETTAAGYGRFLGVPVSVKVVSYSG